MPHLIFKCPYIRGGSKKVAAHLSNYVRYMATREGAQRIAADKAQLPATKKQQQMVEQLLRDFPLSRGTFEYEDYAAAPTRGNAADFITRALEDNYDAAAKKENYISYIASRPRAQRTGSHALFTGSDESPPLSKVAEEIAHHPGNVWLPIISLRREDAARLGYDDAERWKSLLTGYAMEIAQAMKIPWDQFRWYAAFHDESHHPHIHMVCYSADGTSGYLTKQGIADIKSGLAKEIFQNDLTELYQQQTQRRDVLNRDAQEVMRELLLRMEEGTVDNPRIEELMTHLADRLQFLSGKKQYGYLKAPLKAVVDEIVDELARDPRVAKAYDLWYEMREEVLRTYKNDLPERLPLSRQKEFKRIKNMVIQEAIRLGELRQVFHPEDQAEDTLPEQKGADGPQPGPESVWDERPNDSGEPHNSWEQIYRRARAILEDPKAPPEQTAQAVELLTKAAEHGSCSAAFTLGRLYLSGTTLPHDPAAAVRWLERAALGGDQHAQYRLGKLLLQGDAVPKDADGAVRWLTASAEQGNQYAQYALGKLFLLGKDVPEDRKAARQWFQKAAEQGDQYAQYFVERITGQLQKNYGKEGSEIIVDNCQVLISGGFAPASQTAVELSKALGSRTVMSGSISRGKNDPSQSLQMIERPLMTPDELKSMPKGSFIVAKTGVHPMQVRLRLFLDWGIKFDKSYEVPERAQRPVAYASKQELEAAILRKHYAPAVEDGEIPQAEPPASGGEVQVVQADDSPKDGRRPRIRR